MHTGTRIASPRLLAALAHFGLSVDDAMVQRAAAVHQDAPRLWSRLPPGGVTLITGPSGSGKSTLARALAGCARSQRVRVFSAGELKAGVPVIDQLPPGDDEPASSLRVLSRFGLGDATVLARTPVELSDGQRARLALARALVLAQRARSAMVVCDEFTSGLDRPTARALCAAIGRCLDPSARTRLLMVTAHDDVLPWLRPSLHVRVGCDHAITTHEPAASRGVPPRLTVERGTIADYQRLAWSHYRAGRPAMLAPGGILVARGLGEADPLGVMVVAMPTLNGRWRQLAWPGRYQTGDKRGDAQRINRELRTIARVIVDPRFRAMGVARRLVEAYLREPLTCATEAVAAMGAACPFFARAGMTEYRLPPAQRDARLLDALAHRGLDPTDLLHTGAACRLFERDDFLRGELERWLSASRASARVGGALVSRVKAAACSLSAARVAYAHCADVTGVGEFTRRFEVHEEHASSS